MKLLMKIAYNQYNNLFGHRCSKRSGIEYFPVSHFPGLIKKPFEFMNDNGFMLRGGIYHNAKYDKNKIVVFLHGMGGGHEAYMKEIDYLTRNGLQVLAVDYQGTILSEGDKLGGLTQPIIDMTKMVSLIKNDYKDIYLIGHSWGGYVAQGILKLDSSIKRAVFLAGLNSVDKLCEQYYSSLLKRPLKKYIVDVEYQKYNQLSKSSIRETLNREDVEALYIQSNDDPLLKPSLNFHNIKSGVKNQNVEFMLVENKGHNPNYTVESVKCLNAYMAKLNKIKDRNERKALGKSQDWDSMCVLDNEIMDKVVDFLKK